MILIDINMSSNTQNIGITQIHIFAKSPSPVIDMWTTKLFSAGTELGVSTNMTRSADSHNITHKTTLIESYTPYGVTISYLSWS